MQRLAVAAGGVSATLRRRMVVVAAIATSAPPPPPPRHHRVVAAAAASACPHQQRNTALLPLLKKSTTITSITSSLRSSSCGRRCYLATSSGGVDASFQKNPKINEEDSNEESSSSSSSLSSSSSWIPPDRPLVGDKGMQTKGASIFNIASTRDSTVETEIATAAAVVNERSQSAEHAGGDWLQTRRSVMSKTATTTKASLDGDAPILLAIKEHTLLSQNEIVSFLQAMGGSDVKVFLDDPTYRRMGGADGIILITAQQNSHLHVMSNALIQQLRSRKLQDVGVVGAQLGAEGGAIDNGDDEGWVVVDCDNFIVHFLEAHMRKALNLEKLWSGNDDLHKLNFYLDEAVDDYVAANPVPDDYGRRSSSSGSRSLDWDKKLKRLQTSQWPTAATPMKNHSHRRDVQRTKKLSSSRKKKRS